MPNFSCHESERQKLHAFNRKSVQDDLDARELAQAVAHKTEIDDAIAKHEIVRQAGNCCPRSPRQRGRSKSVASGRKKTVDRGRKKRDERLKSNSGFKEEHERRAQEEKQKAEAARRAAAERAKAEEEERGRKERERLQPRKRSKRVYKPKLKLRATSLQRRKKSCEGGCSKVTASSPNSRHRSQTMSLLGRHIQRSDTDIILIFIKDSKLFGPSFGKIQGQTLSSNHMLEICEERSEDEYQPAQLP